MSYYYRQPILVFGIILPAVVMVALCIAAFIIRSKMAASFEHKQTQYAEFQRGKQASLVVEAQVSKDRANMARWQEQLSKETASAVTVNLREISEKLPNKEIQQTAFERPSGTGGYGAASAQKSSQLRIAFRGTFRTMQKAFLELETRMPQLQLQELKIDPSTGPSSLLSFQVTYSAWEK